MRSPHSVGRKMGRTMGLALMVAFLSLGAISGCGNSNNDNDLFGSSGSGGSGGSGGAGGSGGGLGARRLLLAQIRRWLAGMEN
jgi:hypothetical protein